MKRKYLALSFVEILIVLGGLVILSSIGLIGTRYALEKSREAHYKSNVRLLYTALVNFKNDYGRYPLVNSYDGPYERNIYNFECRKEKGCIENEFFANALGLRGDRSKALLYPYFKETFDGGLRAEYYYRVQETDGQFAVICVSLGGIPGTKDVVVGFYCEGDGIGIIPPDNPISKKEIECSGKVPDKECSIILEDKRMSASTWKNGAFSDL